MKTKADELCHKCQKIPWGDNGLTLEEFINETHTNPLIIEKYSEDEINTTIFSALFKYKDVWHCTRCWQLLLDRIPKSMGGNRY